MTLIYELLPLVALLGLSGFFSASETALFSLGRGDLRRLERTPGIINEAIVRLRKDPQDLLVCVLFGNMLVNVLYYALSTVLSTGLSTPGAAWVASLACLIGLIMFGEVFPKAVAVAIPLRVARIAALPLSILHRIIHPVRRGLAILTRLSAALSGGQQQVAYVTPEELQLLIRATGERGEIGLGERDMMYEIMEFAEIRVREVMVPRVDVVAFEVDGDLDEFARRVRETGVAKLPVYQGRIDEVIGVVSARDVLLSGKTLREALQPVPLFVPETALIEAVLHQFRERRCQVAMVVDEYGGWAGIVTLEDIVEEIVGDISDEFDSPADQPVRKIDDDTYVLSGGVSVRDWSDLFGIDVDLAEVETLSGFLALQLGRLPRVGDCVVLGNLRLTVRTVVRRRAVEVLIERLALVESGKEGERP
jgi:putative hemolysin